MSLIARRFVTAAAALAAGAGLAHGQLRVATWNMTHYDGTDRAADIRTATYTAFNGRMLAPDVIAVQEVSSEAALNTLVSVLNTASGGPTDWAPGGFIDGPDWESVLVYRQSKLQLVRMQEVSAGSSSDLTQPPRNTYRFDLRLQGYGNIPQNHIAIYSVHYKAGSTSGDATSDQSRRLLEAQRIRDNAEGANTLGAGSGLPAGYHFIIAGDFNIQSSSQAAYQEMVGSQANNAGRVFDPINSPGSWNNSGSFTILHTQDPTGAGGMDDRHDQLLVSMGLIDGVGLDYIGNAALAYSTSTWNDPNHSYRVWGNDGTSFNLALTTTGNAMVGPTIAQALKNVATTGGGHLPVILDLRVPAKIGTDATTLDFGTVIQNTPAPQRTLQVFNAADTALWTAAGIANLAYTLPGAAGFGVPTGNYADAPGGATNSHTLTMPTTTLGVKNTTLTIASNDPDQPSRVIQMIGQVVANQPPVANAGPDQDPEDSDDNGLEPVTLNGAASFDPDSGGITQYRWTEGATVLYDGSSPTAAVSLAVGEHLITLRVTDVLGATATDGVRITVHAAPPRGCVVTCDINQDGGADNTDISDLAGAIASGADLPGVCEDFNQDGGSDNTDVSDLADAVASGACP